MSFTIEMSHPLGPASQQGGYGGPGVRGPSGSALVHRIRHGSGGTRRHRQRVRRIRCAPDQGAAASYRPPTPAPFTAPSCSCALTQRHDGRLLHPHHRRAGRAHGRVKVSRGDHLGRIYASEESRRTCTWPSSRSSAAPRTANTPCQPLQQLSTRRDRGRSRSSRTAPRRASPQAVGDRPRSTCRPCAAFNRVWPHSGSIPAQSMGSTGHGRERVVSAFQSQVMLMSPPTGSADPVTKAVLAVKLRLAGFVQ